jgi:DNA-binding transcriptional ArsR family regulator
MVDTFVHIAGLVCEPVRATMLWNLLDGRSYTATELALAADISSTSASNHLAKLLEADLLKVNKQGKHRYYSFASEEVAYVVEALANLANNRAVRPKEHTTTPTGIKYCRTCYDHLAGFVGVKLMNALLKKGYLSKTTDEYTITSKGWKWLSQLDITENDTDTDGGRRPFIRECLDWSERRPHLAGKLGALLLEKMFQKHWFRKVRFSRELVLTPKGKQEMYLLLGVTL